MTLVAFDFESEAIENRPKYPPKPVGLAVYVDGGSPYYYGWGHPTGNNTRLDEVLPYFQELFTNKDYEYVAHNLPFDASIVEEHLGIAFPWDRAHDTMLQAFLIDPFGELSLKPLAEQYLGEAPEEQSAVRDWLVHHGVVRSNDKSWGAHISRAPYSIVAPYACGDVRKTLNLYKLFRTKLDGMKAS